VFQYFDFAQSTGVHVENEAAHGDVFGNLVFLLTGERCGQACSKRRSSDRIGGNGAITPEVLRRINWTMV